MEEPSAPRSWKLLRYHGRTLILPFMSDWTTPKAVEPRRSTGIAMRHVKKQFARIRLEFHTVLHGLVRPKLVSRTKQLDQVFASLEESWSVHACLCYWHVLEGLYSVDKSQLLAVWRY